jgi:ketosteroid isomerase-like protein
VCGLIAGLLGCGGTRARVFSAADRSAIEGVMSAQREAWNRGNLDAFMDGYIRGDDLVFTSGSQIRRGWATTLARYRARYGKDRSTMGKLAFDILEIRPLGADGAVVLGRWTLTETSKSGSGVFSVIFERRNDGWRIVHDHTSSDPAKK